MKQIFSSRIAIIIFLCFFVIPSACKKTSSVPEKPVDTGVEFTSVEQSSGVIGDIIVLKGKNFGTDKTKIEVKFNGVSAEVIEAKNTEISVKVPSGASTGKITIKIGDLTLTSTTDFIINANNNGPTITGFSPQHAAGGATITITGSRFSDVAANNEVKINGVTATVINASSTSLSVQVPSKAGSGAVTVSVGGNTTIHTTNFTYDWVVMVSTLAGNGTAGATDATATAAQFNNPAGIAVDNANNVLYVADVSNNKIRKIDLTTGSVSTLAGSGSTGDADNNIGTNAQFDTPFSVTIDKNGNLYVADLNNHKIRKITSTGMVSTLAGAGSLGPGDVDADGTSAKFRYPAGVVSDGDGNLYVADVLNHKIREIVITTGAVSTLVGPAQGTQISGSADGTGTAARFNEPNGIAIDANGNLYVADQKNHKIRKIVIVTGVVTTLAGTGTAGYADGVGSSAQFNRPAGIAVDAKGNIYVADLGNYRIRMISPTGVVSTLAGSGTIGHVDGVGSISQFKYPVGITITNNGDVYVGDQGAHSIRKITLQ